MEGIRLSPDSAKSQTYDMYFLFHFLPRCATTFDLLILQLQDLTVHTQWPSSSHSPVSFSLLIRILSSWWYWFDGHNCSLDAIYGRKQKHQQHRLYIFLTYHKERKSKQTNKNPIWWAFNYETICYFPSVLTLVMWRPHVVIQTCTGNCLPTTNCRTSNRESGSRTKCKVRRGKNHKKII